MWLDAMLRQYGVRLLFTAARVVGMGLTIWLTVVVTNWYRDRNEKRNVGEKERKIIEGLKGDRDYWSERAHSAEALAGDRLATIRASAASISNGALQLSGALHGGKE